MLILSLYEVTAVPTWTASAKRDLNELSYSNILLPTTIPNTLLYPLLEASPEQSWEEAHFFLSSTESLSFFLDDLPQPEVRVPRRENARITIGEFGTLLGRGVSISGTCISVRRVYIYILQNDLIHENIMHRARCI